MATEIVELINWTHSVWIARSLG